jgi:hypothetical protein
MTGDDKLKDPVEIAAMEVHLSTDMHVFFVYLFTHHDRCLCRNAR